MKHEVINQYVAACMHMHLINDKCKQTLEVSKSQRKKLISLDTSVKIQFVS